MVTIDFGLMATVLGVLGTLGGLAAGVVKMIQRLSAVEARLTESAGAMQVLCKGGLRQPGRAEAAGLQRAGDAGAQGIAGDAVREVGEETELDGGVAS